MKKHEFLSPQARAALFNPPGDPAAIIRHNTFSPDDLALIRRRRHDANRLGFAVHLAYQRFPGRVLGINETPPADVLSFIAGQLGIEPEIFREYARREETRWEYLGDIQSYCAFLSTAVIIGLSQRLRRPKRLAWIAARSLLPP